MPRNGSGTYSLPAGNPVVTGTSISSTTHNNTNNDIATALTASIAKDGQTTPTANLPMGTFKHTNVGAAASLTDYGRYDQVQNSAPHWLTSVSGADTITASAPLTPSAYAAGQTFRFVSAGANTGAVTLNVSSLGAKDVTKTGTTALVAGDIPSGAVVEVTYDGTRFQLINVATAAPSGSITSSGYTMATARLLGRTTASTGAIEEISAGSGITLSSGTLSSNGLKDIQTFTATGAGTWTKPSGISANAMVLIELWGAGGSGASRATTGNVGGGGGGGHVYLLIKASLLAATETVTIGAGGAGVSGNTAGNAGGNTSMTIGGITAYYADGGGAGATAATGAAAAAGTGGSFSVASGWLQNSITNNVGYGGSGGDVTSGNVPQHGAAHNSVMAGGGGGASSSTAGGDRTAGSSLNLGTSGGAGGANTGGNGTAGGTSCGGGGAVNGGTSGAGGNGYARVTTFD